MRFVALLIVAVIATSVFAKLPPPTEAEQAKAAETAAKAAWTDKVALYQLCVVQDRTADAYRKSIKQTGKGVPAPLTTTSCANPGPYVSQVTPAAAKPSEASGAHSPPGAAVSPPSTNATAAEISRAPKK